MKNHYQKQAMKFYLFLFVKSFFFKFYFVMLKLNFYRKEVAPELVENFNHLSYFDFLKTKTLGKILLYVPVCNNTIEIANRFFLFE